MAEETQQYEGEQEYPDDPIIAELGITDEVVPGFPFDIVFGYYRKMPPEFRLYHKTFGCYMEGPLSRVARRKPASSGGSEVWLRTNGNYPADITIVCSVDPEEAMEPVEPTYTALYARYAYPKTTPWHEW
ncbi:MAG TPA: hypothetical protein VFH11_08525 [Gemmatimonadota bacterium]|nr:hypothetical protein [Gemmatimonadota bacterium]